MKILLVWPKARGRVSPIEALGWGSEGAIAEPLALEYLAAGAKLDGHEAQILDLRLHPDALGPTLDTFAPDVVGVTGYSLHVLAALEVCRQVKLVLPECSTVVGGHHATLLPEDFFEPQIDFVVGGEGVRPLRALLESLSKGGDCDEPISEIPGLWSRAGPGPQDFHWGGDPSEFEIDSLPYPDRGNNAADRSHYFIDEMKPVALLRSTVGCPFRCSFCSLWRIMAGRYHVRDVDAVVDELRTIEEEWVFLVDDEAFINGKRMRKLADAIASAGIQKRFFAYCRIDTLLREREVLAAWHQIGLRRLFIGIEAISTDLQEQFNKKLELSQIERGLAAAREIGIDVMGQFIVPTQASKRDFKRLARFVEHHRIRFPTFTILTPIPGTDLLTDFKEVIDLQPNGRPNWDSFDCQTPVTKTHLPLDTFMAEYKGLQRLFGGRFVNYWKPERRDESSRLSSV